MIGYGIDLSHAQQPAQLPWESWRGKVDFVIARATYGTRHDETAVEHIRRARDIGAKVGLYAFFRISESVDDQLSSFHAVADLCRLDEGDIVPAIDIERDPFPSPGADVAPGWSDQAKWFTDVLVSTWGDALVYINQASWSQLGKPAWVLRRPLWIAHWTDGIPATPAGIPATIHQHRVGTFVAKGPGGYFANDALKIDQDRVLRPLPLIGQPISVDEQERIENQVTAWLTAERELSAPEPFPLPKREA